MFKRTVGKKKKKCRKIVKECMSPYNDSSRILSALDERLNDIERRGRSRKKKRSPPLKPMLKRAASTPSKIPCHYDHRSSNSDYPYKSVRFQNHPYSCHMSGLSPPPCQGRNALRKLTSDTCAYTPTSRTCAGDAVLSGSKSYLHDRSANYGGYSKSINNNYACISSAPSFKLHSSENPSSKYGYSDYDKGGETKNWKLALKLDELMLKYNEFITPNTKSFKANGSPYPLSGLDAKNGYGDVGRSMSTTWKQETPGLSRKAYTSPYKDYLPSSSSFSKYASFYGDNLGVTSSSCAASANFNPYGSYRPDAYKSFNDNRSAYNNDPADWAPSKTIASEMDLRNMRTNSNHGSFGLNSSNNKYTPGSTAAKFGEDLKFSSGTTLSYDLSKFKGELFSSGSLLNSQGNESARVSKMLSEYQRMDYYRKTMHSQRQTNFELLQKYVYATPKKNCTEFLCNKNDNRKSFDIFTPGSTMDEKMFNSIKKKYEPLASAALNAKFRSSKYSNSADNIPVLTRSRSLSSGAVDHRGLSGARSVLDVTLDRCLRSGKYSSRGTSADDVRSFVHTGADANFKEHVSRCCKTPEDFLAKPQFSASLSKEFRRRSPSNDTDPLTQSYSFMNYSSNKTRNYSPLGQKKDFLDAGNKDGAGLYGKGSSITKMSTPCDYSSAVSRDICGSKSSGLSNDYSASDYQTMLKYGLKSDKPAYSKNLNSTNNWSNKSPVSISVRKKSDTVSPSFYLGARAMRDMPSNSNQDSVMKKLDFDESDYFSSNRGKNADRSPRKGTGGASSGMPEEKFMSTNIGSKVPPVSYSCKHVINLCIDDETNRLNNINSLIKKSTHLGNSSNNNPMADSSRNEPLSEM